MAAELVRKIMMALPATFLVWLGIASAGCDDDGLNGSLGSSGDRRAVIGEGTDARHPVFGRTGHRGASQHEGEGKDEAEGPHLTVSDLACPARPPFRWERDSHPLFQDVCARSGKWFRHQENCFVAGPVTKQFSENFN
ncbi:MAG: hypothetical protein Q8M18_09465 [Bradyrhizobium sp.]|nr:hypothetical protein [Bradyrhizobium sp.]